MSKLAKRMGLDPRALVGLLVLVGGTLLWVVAFTGGLSTLFASNTKTVKADFASVEDIVTNDPVRIHGVQVGTVGDVVADPGGRGATLKLDIDTSDPIYKDASASILWRTALGANDAVSIDPGTRAAGLLGKGTLPQSQDSNQVELDQITQAFHGGAQSGLQTMLQQVGPAFSDHPALGNDLTILANVAPAADVGIGAVRGQIPDTDLRNLVKDAGQAAQAITVGTNGSETRQFVQSAGTTLTALSANQQALANGVFQFSQTVIYAGDYLGQDPGGLDHAVYVLDPLITKLLPVVPKVAPTLAQLHPTVNDLDTLLHDATPLLDQLRPTVHSLADTAKVGVPVINNLKPGLDNLANKVLPGLAEKYPEEGGRPAYEEIGSSLVGLSVADFFNRDGELANLTAGLGEAQSQEFLPCTLDFSGTDFIVCNTLSQTLQQFFDGGVGLLQGLAKRPGGASVFGKLLSGAEKTQSALAATEQQLQSVAPGLVKYLFDPNHGNAK